MKNILILGIGNIFRKDDGAGIHLVRRILDSGIDIPGNVEIVDGGTAFYDLVPIMSGKDHIIIADALKVDDKPGSIYRFPPKHLKFATAQVWFPAFSIQELIFQVNLAGYNPTVEIIGIVPEDFNTLEIGLSEPVKRSMPEAISEILKAVRQ
ncbi:MAG TPA: hydrogenase maturation protease [Spirochaetota bacterium]|nr:hydrogenase maturation protease [Spirochaetota bacterium]HPC42534.1 hydrogenase maturation protease [Spirochaetota bacterium]HPL15488.1 hydrogenase maturation protease [Spirochaetota bacterium]HQF10178.1 hydrogenase maturation protease [Spirochaetota bacterium]HQH98962.1 hydrogenase maturation protease [Spirochaetota bacterium]